MKCPICEANESDEQPQSGTHCYTVVFDCGTEIVMSYSSDEWFDYQQRCDETRKKSVMDQLKYPDTLNFSYVGQHIPLLCKKTIFLVDSKTHNDWKNNAIEYIKNSDFTGWVFVPELDKTSTDLYSEKDKVEWEKNAMQQASVIVYWFSEHLNTATAIKQGVDLGYWLSRKKNKIVVGCDADAEIIEYLKQYDIPVASTIEETIQKTFKLIDTNNDSE